MIACLNSREEKSPCAEEPVEQSLSHNRAKAMLAGARAPDAQKRAVTAAMKAGMPLHEIEVELDWADARREHQGLTMVANRCDDSDSDLQSGNELETSEYVFVLPNDQARITPVVEFLSAEAIRVAACDEMEQMRISLALEEALANALYHGNLEIDSSDADTGQMCRHDVAICRRSQQPYCNRHIQVLATIARRAAVFVVRDEGHGFDSEGLPDPTHDANLERSSGRGVFLMRSLMDRVIFNEIGNEVTMVRQWAV
jgi:anti-sigma regulatory factor (Ser/Thr protein kinase)